MHADLSRRLTELKYPVRVGIVGIGSMGKGLVAQCEMTPGMRCVAIADLEIERAVQCAQALGRDFHVVESTDALNSAIRQGGLAVCQDANLIAQADGVDVFLDSSNAIAASRNFGATAIMHRKHVVMMNAEADLIFGPQLVRLAQSNGVVYTSCEGDQHVTIKRLVDEIRFWGFELVMAGNIKGFLDRYSNPTKIIPEADKRMLDYRMATSYTDGTKLNIEMALCANALGLRTDVPGMHGPRALHVRDALKLFDLPMLWKNREPVVDYVLGAEPKGGVFVIGYTENKIQRNMLAWYPSQMGDGPFYVFYRPYHLGHIEAMSTVALAALDGQASLQPGIQLRTNVYAYAKRNLRAGEKLDGIGGYACYGLIENVTDNAAVSGAPVCLAEGLELRRDIAKDERISAGDVIVDPHHAELALLSQADPL